MVALAFSSPKLLDETKKVQGTAGEHHDSDSDETDTKKLECVLLWKLLHSAPP